MQRLLAMQPERLRHIVLLSEPSRRGELGSHCNRFARQQGIRVGMPISEARTFAHTSQELYIEPRQPDLDRQALGELALRCEAYSPTIGLEEADDPDCLLMDVTGVDYFFGGEWALMEHLEQTLFAQQLSARIAIAHSIGAAWACAHFYQQKLLQRHSLYLLL